MPHLVGSEKNKLYYTTPGIGIIDYAFGENSKFNLNSFVHPWYFFILDTFSSQNLIIFNETLKKNFPLCIIDVLILL